MRTLDHPDPNVAPGSAAAPEAGRDTSQDAPASLEVVREQTEIAAPVDAVFDALVDPEQLAGWCRATPATALTEWRTDVRPGGRWEGVGTDGTGRRVRVAGTYTTVERARRLETTWEADEDARPSVVRFDLEPVVVGGRAGTRLTVTHTVPRTGRSATVSCTAPTMAAHAGTWVTWREQVERMRRLVVHTASASAPGHASPLWLMPPSIRRPAVLRAHRAYRTYTTPVARSTTP